MLTTSVERLGPILLSRSVIYTRFVVDADESLTDVMRDLTKLKCHFVNGESDRDVTVYPAYSDARRFPTKRTC